MQASSELVQTTLRSVLGQHELDEMLAERERLNNDVRAILDQQTDALGIKVSNIEIKHMELDENMVRAIARQAEAERARRAKPICVEGEQPAAQKLVKTARIPYEQPQAIQLRCHETLAEMAGDKSNTLVFPLPMDLLEPLLKK
ncbi:MAG: hypothetical protein H6964_15180 [Chromatiaceae bacterium]|nr:hypothetical protein [Gammaproteobacteria bacterium]MCP5448317.1 hypothetical protein [Chromatiaceae bacterium]